VVSTRTPPDRSVRATVAWVAPTSVAAANPAPGLKASRAEGRPPVDGAPDTGATSPSLRRGSRRELMAARPRPVIPARSALVRGRPSRRSCKSSPGPPLSMSLQFGRSKEVNGESEVLTYQAHRTRGPSSSLSVEVPVPSRPLVEGPSIKKCNFGARSIPKSVRRCRLLLGG
jgi:hypothetical protein